MKTLAELEAIRNKVRPQLVIRKERENIPTVYVDTSTDAIAAGSKEVLAAFVNELEKRSILDVAVIQKGVATDGKDVVVEVVDGNGNKKVYEGVTPDMAAKMMDDILAAKA